MILVVAQHYARSLPEGHRNISARLIDAAFHGRRGAAVVSLEAGSGAWRSGNILYIGDPRIHPYLYRGLRHYADIFVSRILPVIKSLRPRAILLLNIAKELYTPLTRLAAGTRTTIYPYIYNAPGYFTCPHSICRMRRYFWRTAAAWRPIEVLATCGETSRLLMELGGVEAHTVPPIIPDEFYGPRPGLGRRVRERLGVADDSFLYLYAGHLDAKRGVHILAEAWRRIYPRLGDAVLAVAPAPTEYTAENRFLHGLLEKLPSTIIVGENVVKEHGVHGLYAAADAVVLPFTHHYFFTAPPLTLLEAMAMGAAVVASRIPCIDEWVRDGETGFLAEPGSVESLGEAMERALRGIDPMRPRSVVEARCRPGTVAGLIQQIIGGEQGGV